MRNKYSTTIRKTILAVACIITFINSYACGVDQNQPTYNGGTSERNLPGYYEWQSFTAGHSGNLCRIDLMFCNSNIILNGSGILKVFKGTGISGALLTTQNVNVNGTAYPINTIFWQTWNINTPPSLKKDSVYTFQFIPVQGGGLPDPYLIQVNTNNPYPGGRNSQSPNFDSPFKTYLDNLFPLNFISFDGKKTDNNIQLSWSVNNIRNNQLFTVEKSNDGKHFTVLQKIEALQNSGAEQTYQATDPNPLTGINYYRIKQTDFDQQYSYSGIIGVAFKRNFRYRLFPNPAHGYFIFEKNNTTQELITLYNSEGKKLSQQWMANNYTNLIDIQQLPKGNYYVIVNNSTEPIVLPLIVQ